MPWLKFRSVVFTLFALFLVGTTVSCSSAESADEAHVEAMEREHVNDSTEPSLATSTEPAAETTGSETTYARLGDRDISGYLARPATGDSGAGLILIHEWWGLNDNVRAMADRFAGEGYTALAIDLYEGEVATDRAGASTLARATFEKTDRLNENLRQAQVYLTEQAGAAKVGSVGWCFGGGWSLNAAIHLGNDLDAAVIYYGRVTAESARLEFVRAPILGHFGALDDGIPVESVREFESALVALGKTATIHVYDDADHAFANPTGNRYNKKAASAAWRRTLEFFGEHLR